MSLLLCNPFLWTDPDTTQETHSSRVITIVQAELWKVFTEQVVEASSRQQGQLGQLMRNSSDHGCKLNLATSLTLFGFVQQTPFGLTPTGLNSLLA